MRYLPSIVLLFLAGCATTQYGNYIEDTSSSHNAIIATDAAYQLTQLYPPASTTFSLRHPATDPFGSVLLERLRNDGYAVKEYIKTNPLEQDAPAQYDGAALAYVLDQSSNVYRLSLTIDGHILTRAYRYDDKQLAPGGAWVFKE